MAADVTVFSTKTSEEEEVFTFDFADLLEAIPPATTAQTISSIFEFSIKSLKKNLTYDPDDMLVGTADDVGTKVLCLIGGGLNGCTYLIKCSIITSGGEKKTLFGELKIDDGPLPIPQE